MMVSPVASLSTATPVRSKITRLPASQMTPTPMREWLKSLNLSQVRVSIGRRLVNGTTSVEVDEMVR